VDARNRPSELVARLHDEIVAVAERFHASDIRVFGSVGSGTDTNGSDLDLLVHFADQATLYDQIGLIDELGRLLGIRVDVVSDTAPGIERISDAAPLCASADPYHR
jgi:predicted nucleotidyltransferase